MQPAMIVSLCLGSIAVLQAATNRRIASTWGLAPTIFLNGLVVVSLSAVFAFVARLGYVDALAPGARPGEFSPFWLIPGVFGFLLITGLPWAVGHIGATRVFVGVVFAQMATSLVWDRLMEGIAFSPTRIAGAALCAVGVVLAARG